MECEMLICQGGRVAKKENHLFDVFIVQSVCDTVWIFELGLKTGRNVKLNVDNYTINVIIVCTNFVLNGIDIVWAITSGYMNAFRVVLFHTCNGCDLFRLILYMAVKFIKVSFHLSIINITIIRIECIDIEQIIRIKCNNLWKDSYWQSN